MKLTSFKRICPNLTFALKDGKSYPFIKITKELYPRLLITHGVKKDGGLYFGPYPDSGAANEIKESCWTVFSPLRNVKILLTRSVSITILANVCPHPSVTPLRDYWQGLVEDVKNFLNGHDDKIVNQLKEPR